MREWQEIALNVLKYLGMSTITAIIAVVVILKRYKKENPTFMKPELTFEDMVAVIMMSVVWPVTLFFAVAGGVMFSIVRIVEAVVKKIMKV